MPSENFWFSEAFRGVPKGTIGLKWVKASFFYVLKEKTVSEGAVCRSSTK